MRVVDVAALDFPLLRTQADWEHGELPASLLPAQQDIAWCEHMVLFFPLWLGDMPALLYRFFFRAHSVKSLERNILGFVGIAPSHDTLIGMVANLTESAAVEQLGKLRQLGVLAA